MQHLTPTLLTTLQDTTNVASYPFASVTVSANAAVFVCVINSRTAGGTLPTISGLSMTWTQVATVTYDDIAGGVHRNTVFRGFSTGGATGVITVDFGAVNQTGCGGFIVEYSGVDATTLVVQSNTNRADAGTAVSVTLGAFAHHRNGTLLFVGSDAGTAGAAYAAESALTELGEGTFINPATRFGLFHRNGRETTPAVTIDAAADWGAIAIEINAHVTVWEGDVSSNVATDGNWSNNAPRVQSYAILANSSADATGTISGVMASLCVHPTYTGNWGTSASPVSMSSSLVILRQRNGSFHMTGSNATVLVAQSVGTADATSFASSIGTRFAHLGSGGRVSIAASTIAAIVESISLGSPSVILGSGIVTGLDPYFTTLRVLAGHVESASGAATEIVKRNGSVKMTGTGDRVNVTVGGAGTYELRGGNGATNAKAIDGRLTVGGNGLFTTTRNAYSLVTIDDITTYGGTSDFSTNGTRAVALTNDLDYYGGRIRWDAGDVVDF